MNAKTAMETIADADARKGLSGAAERKSMNWDKDKMVHDLKSAVDDAQALLKEAMESSASGLSDTPAYLDGRLDAAKAHLQKVKNAVEAKAKHASEVTEQYVRENPWKSMGFATAASIFISVLLVSASMTSMWKTFGDRK